MTVQKYLATLVHFEIDASGRVYILDYHAQEVRVFDRFGTFEYAFGRLGPGPGEMTGGAGLSLDASGRLWLWDFRNSRLTEFRTDGTYLRSLPRPTSGVIFGWRGGFADDGLLYDFGVEFTGVGRLNPDWGTGYRISPVRLHPESGDVERLPPLEASFDLMDDGTPRPLSPRLTFALDPSGGVVVGNQSELRLWKTAVTGDTILEFGLLNAAPASYPAESDSMIGRPWGPQGRRLRPSDLPERRLVMRMVFVGTDGRVFATSARGDQDGRVHYVFGAKGEYLGQLTTPVRLVESPLPIVRGDTLWGVTTDSLGVEYFVRARLFVRPPSRGPAAASTARSPLPSSRADSN